MKPVFKKVCKKCGNLFLPTGKYCKFCDNCKGRGRYKKATLSNKNTNK